LLAVIAGALIAVIANISEDEPDTVDLGPTTTLDPSTLSAEGQELYSLVQASEAGTYHVGYTVTSPDLAAAGAATQLEVWKDGELFREQRVGVDASGNSTTVLIGGPDGAVTCGGAVGAPPTCADEPDPQPALSSALATVIAQLPDADTTVVDATVANLPARCFTVSASDRTLETCLSLDGIPLRINDGSIGLEASLVEATVPPEVLVLPAVGAGAPAGHDPAAPRPTADDGPRGAPDDRQHLTPAGLVRLGLW
jgi:hypothetical protein